MPDVTPATLEEARFVIERLAAGDALVFDPLPPRDGALVTCGKCGQCGVCQVGKEEQVDLDHDLDVLRKRIERNPEILRDIKNRFNLPTVIGPNMNNPG